MKRLLLPLLAAASLALAVACGGGTSGPPVAPTPGGGSAPPPLSPTPSATPAASPSPEIVNTSLTMYLPLARGNYWIFSPGSRMDDVGAFWLICTCPYTYGLMEEIDVHDPLGKFGGSLFFTKQEGSTGTLWSQLIAVRQPGAALASLIYDPVYPQGLPVMDDVPVIDETWSVTAGGAKEAVSTIASVGGTLSMPNNRQLVDVAADELDEAMFGETMTISFARGVGFSTVAIGGQTANLTFFGIDTLHSYAAPVGVGSVPGVLQPADIGAVLRRLFI